MMKRKAMAITLTAAMQAFQQFLHGLKMQQQTKVKF